MKYIADLHIHSAYSRATSKLSNLVGLAAWAAVKGIHVLGTGDFTHPEWFGQICEQLIEAEPGFYKLKPEYQQIDGVLPRELKPSVSLDEIRFVLTSEISSIYKKNDRVRKNHNIVFAPDIESVRRINQTLGNIGNLKSDGRPILGLDARNLLEIVLEKAPEGFFVPAHIWTPWFSLFGSKSGFDRIEECFEDLTPHIFALETGLSSDPEMNRRVSALDEYTFISNSDCHSPAKLGREANIFTTDFDFFHMREAIRQPVDDNGNQVFHATVEFYPEEGKYHCDGHRKCNICLDPEETVKYEGKCPECGKPLTVGVLHRVMALADRSQPHYNPYDPAFFSITPVPEILSELLGVGPATKKVAAAYAQLITLFGSEFELLLDVPIEDIAAKSSPLIGEAIRRVRNNEVIRTPGFDGEFGVIRVFDEGEREQVAGQLSMFAPLKKKKRTKQSGTQKTRQKQPAKHKDTVPQIKVLNPEQDAALNDRNRIVMVKAGPGTGKTHTLVQRVVKTLLEEKTNCTVISFTNKAADEVRERIIAQTGKDEALQSRLKVFTFHGYCLHWLKKKNPQLKPIGPTQRKRILHSLFPDIAQIEFKEVLQQIAEHRNTQASQRYLFYVERHNRVDLDHILREGLTLLLAGDELACQMGASTGHLFVDEFQDVNHTQYELVLALAQKNPVFV
ncbi:MAG: DNA helicase II, partial [Desulfobulbus propionicus]